jgi:hypothetical protein
VVLCAKPAIYYARVRLWKLRRQITGAESYALLPRTAARTRLWAKEPANFGAIYRAKNRSLAILTGGEHVPPAAPHIGNVISAIIYSTIEDPTNTASYAARLPASASQTLYSRPETEAGSTSKSVIGEPSNSVILLM